MQSKALGHAWMVKTCQQLSRSSPWLVPYLKFASSLQNASWLDHRSKATEILTSRTLALSITGSGLSCSMGVAESSAFL